MNSLNTHPNSLILASESPYKRALLEKIYPHFESISPLIDESPIKNESPYDLAVRLAKNKAEAALESMTTPQNCWVLGCDQVAILNGDQGNQIILNKPETHERAVKQLRACSGQKIEYFTACALTHSNSKKTIQLSDSFFLQFKTLTSQQISQYLLREKPYDCAGSIKSEGLGILLIKKFEGNDPNTLIGLPLLKLTSALEQIGFDLFAEPNL